MKVILRKVFLNASRRARQRRGELFRRLMQPTERDKILDLGGGDGSHIASIVPFRHNVYVADILPDALKVAEQKYGFQTILLQEGTPLPFEDHSFDIVFCSSVIEHVTIPKEELYTCKSGREFARRAWKNQQWFANEIRRLGQRYFVQTPHRYFILESHTWLPMPVALLPRPVLLKLIPLLNRYWIKQTQPDWHLLTPRLMRQLFPDGQIVIERWCGLPKSIIAYRQAIQEKSSP